MSGYLCRSSQQQSAQGLDGGQIRALFDNCLKLASENKITAKNTWDLPLIDHLSDLVQVLPRTMRLGPDLLPGRSRLAVGQVIVLMRFPLCTPRLCVADTVVHSQ